MSKSKESKTTRADRIRKVKAGLQKYYASTSLVLGGTTYTPAALQSLLQGDIDANDASTVARAEWLSAVKAARATDATVDPVLSAIEHAVQAQYAGAASESTVLADFGYASPNRRTLTAAEKSAAAAKARATRQARHTMGARQKAKVTGSLPAAGADGASSGAPAAGTPAPAAPAPGGSAPAHS